MLRTFAVTVFTLSMLAAAGARASTPDDACAALMEARGFLVAMIGTSDRAALDDLKAKVHAASASLDGVLAAMSRGDAGNQAKAAAFRPTWEAFKNTREGEIIPHLYAGRVAEAKALAGGIQAERMKQMRGVMACK